MYTPEEIDQIRAEAMRSGLDHLRCPRDGEQVRVEMEETLPIQEPAAVRGVRVGQHLDVRAIHVDCPLCRRSANSIPLID
jgi:hypothetical protein